VSDNADKMNMQNTIGEQIKEYRLKRLWTLRQMSEATGVPIPTLQKIEKGKVRPHELTIRKITQALNEPDNSGQAA
jgi:transcriptional regulator with XRE-family HTH domain